MFVYFSSTCVLTFVTIDAFSFFLRVCFCILCPNSETAKTIKDISRNNIKFVSYGVYVGEESIYLVRLYKNNMR